MDDPNNHPEAICPSFPDMVKYMDSLGYSKDSFLLDADLAYYLYEIIKPEILVRLHSCNVIDAHNKSLHNISLETKKIMCYQLFKARYFCYINRRKGDAISRNVEPQRPWCTQRWLLPSLGYQADVFSARFDFYSLSRSLRAYIKARNLKVNISTFHYCYDETRNIFCELLFMYLFVKHEDISIEQMMKDHQKFQPAYEQYACRQWQAQHEVVGRSERAMMPLIAEDLVRIDIIDDGDSTDDSDI